VYRHGVGTGVSTWVLLAVSGKMFPIRLYASRPVGAWVSPTTKGGPPNIPTRYLMESPFCLGMVRVCNDGLIESSEPGRHVVNVSLPIWFCLRVTCCD